MKKQRKIASLIMAVLLAIVLAVSILPQTAYAWIGPVLDTNPTVQIRNNNDSIRMFNDYLTFETDHGQDHSLAFRTVPKKYFSGTLSQAMQDYCYQELQFSVQYTGEEEKLLSVDTVTKTVEDNKVVFYINFNEDISAKVNFRMVQATNGLPYGGAQFPIKQSDYLNDPDLYGTWDDYGQTWMIEAECMFDATKLKKSGIFYMKLLNHRMPFWGHEDEENPKKIMASACDDSTAYQGYSIASMRDLSEGCAKTASGTMTEVGTFTYDEANPFVGLSVMYDHFRYYEHWGDTYQVVGAGVDGLGEMAGPDGEYVSYNPQAGRFFNNEEDLLTVWADDDSGWFTPGDPDPGNVTSLLWGYRNLYKSGETVKPLFGGTDIDAEPINPDFQGIETNASGLAIVPVSGSDNKRQTVALKPGDAVPNNAIAVLRGTFTGKPAQGYYDFTQGTVHLSSTTTASFEPNGSNYFRVYADGTIKSKGITRIDLPNCCLYRGAGDAGEEPKFTFDEKNEGLIVQIDPNNNEAYMKVNIPYSTTKVGQALVKNNGDIVLSGTFSVLTIFDNKKFDLEKLSLGYKGTDFTINGLKANIDASGLSLAGLKIPKAKGTIDTFEQYYNFDVAVNAYDIFKFAAKLELKKNKKDGTLLPNKLYGELSVDPKIGGIMLVPPAPLVEINGGGIGFDHLADTINGDYIAIPPFSVTIKAIGTIAKVIGGHLAVTAGPTGVKIEGTELKAPPSDGFPLVDSAEVHFFVEGAKKVNREKTGSITTAPFTYTGVNLNGGLSASINVLRYADPSNLHDWSGTIVFNGGINLNAFGGTRQTDAGKTRLLLDVDASGSVSAEVHVPKWVKVIGGKKLFGQAIHFGVGAKTVVDLGGSTLVMIKNAISNLEGHVGICWIGNVGDWWGRVYFITPDKFDADSFSSEPGVILEEIETDDPSVNVALLCDEDGEQVGLAVFETGLEEQNAIVTKVTAEEDGNETLPGEEVKPMNETLPEGGDEILLEEAEESEEIVLEEGSVSLSEDIEEGNVSLSEALEEGSVSLNADAASEYTIQLPEGTTVNAGDDIVLEVTAEDTQISPEQFLAGLIVDDTTPAVEMQIDEYTGDVISGNTMVQVDDETGAITAYISVGNTIKQWKLTSANPIKAPSVIISRGNKFETLENASFNGQVVSMDAIHLDKDSTYEMHTYMGKEKGKSDYQIDTADAVTRIPAQSASYSYSVNVPTSGQAAESGDYYISTALMKVVEMDKDGDGQISEDEITRVAIARWESDSTIAYTNTNTPAAPASVLLDAGGNETLIVNFKEVKNADGYRLQIYQNGEDTGYGYDFVQKDGMLEAVGNSAAVTKEDGRYIIRLAPTAGGDILTDGGVLLEEEGLPAPERLAPGSGYQVGVSAYKNIEAEQTALSGEGEEETEDEEMKTEYPVYSAVTMSGEAEITEYQPAEFVVKMNGKTLQQDAESGIYEVTVSDANKALHVEVTTAGNYELSAVAETDEEGTPDTLTSANNVLEGNLGTIDGAVLYDITAEDKNTKDKTTVFLRVCKDDVPPVVLLDADTYYTDADGNYSVTGTTEAGATVNGVQADENGRFEITGKLPAQTEQYGLVTEKMIRFLWLQEVVENIETEEGFNSLIAEYEEIKQEGGLYSYSIEPSTWQGAGSYKLVIRMMNYEPYHKPDRTDEDGNPISDEDYLAMLQKLETQGKIEELSELWDAFEISEAEIGSFQDEASPDYRIVEARERTITDDSREIIVKATDELGNESDEIPALVRRHAHKITEVAEVPATVEKEGIKAHFICTECGEKFADAAGTIPAGDLSIPKLVRVPLTKLTLNKTSAEIVAKSKLQLQATLKPADTTDTMVWKSSDTKVATVDQTGKVTAKGIGNTTITVTAKEDSSKKATCKITVKFTDAYYNLDGTGKSNVTKEMETAIYWAANKKITGETVSFGTKNSMTRGQFVRFLYRYAGNPKVTDTMIKKYGSKFKDVDKNYTHFKAIVWAVSKGLIGGYSDGTFKPNGTLTRNNVATILWKFAGSPKVSNPKKPFSDVAKSAAIAWGKNKKIFTGTKFMPKSDCIRGDFALFLYRYDKTK